MSYDNNKLYRFLNIPISGTESIFKNDNRIYEGLEAIVGENNIGYDEDDSNKTKIKISYENNETFSLEKAENSQTYKIYINGSEVDSAVYFAASDNDTFNFNSLFIKTANSGALSYCENSTEDKPSPYLSTRRPYIIFTKVKHLNSGEEFPCIILEKSTTPSSSSGVSGYIYIKIFNNDPNVANVITLPVVTNDILSYQIIDTKINQIQTLPIIAQMTLKFDDYIFPYLYKKASNFEGDFGFLSINKKKYYFTQYFGILLEGDE